jgi:hypothetical protein
MAREARLGAIGGTALAQRWHARISYCLRVLDIDAVSNENKRFAVI